MVFHTNNPTYTIYLTAINKFSLSFVQTDNGHTIETRETYHLKQRVADELLAGGGFFAENFHLVPVQEFLVNVDVFDLVGMFGGTFAVVCQFDTRFGVNGITERTGGNRIAFLNLVRIRNYISMVVERIGDHLMLVLNRIVEAEIHFNRVGVT